MRNTNLVIIFLAFTLSTAAWVVAAEPQYGICQSQIVADLEKRFQQKVTQIEFTYTTGKSGRGGERNSTALVYTDACPGYHVYDVYATDYDCESRAHYGTPPNYVRYRVSADGC
jgi:hypothetical protein